MDKISNSEKFIKSLKVKRSSCDMMKRSVGKGKEGCSICLQDDEEEVSVLECNHVFHQSCIVKWVREKNTCPLCRCKLYDKNANAAAAAAAAVPRRRTQPRMSVMRSTIRFSFSMPTQGRPTAMAMAMAVSLNY
ncbi:hypothetical protein AgCh_035242 [Apium graveolens]